MSAPSPTTPEREKSTSPRLPPAPKKAKAASKTAKTAPAPKKAKTAPAPKKAKAAPAKKIASKGGRDEEEESSPDDEDEEEEGDENMGCRVSLVNYASPNYAAFVKQVNKLHPKVKVYVVGYDKATKEIKMDAVIAKVEGEGKNFSIIVACDLDKAEDVIAGLVEANDDINVTIVQLDNKDADVCGVLEACENAGNLNVYEGGCMEEFVREHTDLAPPV
jgi:hypothetical protein